jgi:hypothetical protein
VDEWGLAASWDRQLGKVRSSQDQKCLGRHDEHTTTTYAASRHRTAVSYRRFFERVHEACRSISSFGESPLFELLYIFRNWVNELDCEMVKSKLERRPYIEVSPNTGHQVLLGRSINGVYTIKTCCLCPFFSMPVIEIESRKPCPTCYPAICTSPLTNTWGGTERNSSQPYQNRQGKASEQ